MILRPASAKWFELLVPRDDLASALRCLAGTGQIELQTHTDVSAAHLLPALRAVTDEYKRLAQRYAQYWPPAAATPIDRKRESEQLAQEALKQLQTWATGADALVTRLRHLEHERAELEALRALLSHAVELPDMSRFTHAGPLLANRLFLLDPAAGPLGIPPSVLIHQVASADGIYLFALGPKEQIAILDGNSIAARARRLELPAQLPSGRDAALAATTTRLGEIQKESQALGAQLEQGQHDHALSAVLADLQFVEWLIDHVPELPMTEHFAWVTGWTSDGSGARLQAALDRARIQHLLRFPEAPPDLARPVVLRNPRWARPFEIFPKLLGVPAASEADPSPIVAVIAPLMFGFMFGDVGQGAVLLLAGLALRRRYPSLALLLPGGAAAMLFGFLFGSVFAREDLLPAAWLRPLAQPLTLFGVSLGFGALVICAGLVLDAIQHHWVQQGKLWWSTRAGLLLCYVAAMASAFDLNALWLVPAGLLWCWLGSGIRRLGARMGESIETLLQLFVNTVSFVRVGAFALAHAGLAAALAGLAAGTDSRIAYWALLIVGNVLILVMEGLVVAIQTTRLILFEFFVRFLRGAGRPFRPLLPPSAATSGRSS